MMTFQGSLALARKQPFLAVAIMLMVASMILSAVVARIAFTTSRDVDTALSRLDEQVENDAAQLCVNAWVARAQLRNAISVPVEAIIEVAVDAPPETVATLRAIVDRRVHEVFPDPDCDLRAAQSELAS